MAGRCSDRTRLANLAPNIVQLAHDRQNPMCAAGRAAYPVSLAVSRGCAVALTIERSVKTAEVAKVTPSEEDILSVLAQVGMHPEFALSWRELIRYVLSAPGDRAKEVQTLLRLDQVEELRIALQKIANARERQLKPLATEKTAARDQLIKKLEISDLTAKTILEAVNPRRVLLGFLND